MSTPTLVQRASIPNRSFPRAFLQAFPGAARRTAPSRSDAPAGAMGWAACLVLASLVACAQPEPEPSARRVENETLNLVFADLPASLELSNNSTERIELQPRPPAEETPTSPAEQARRLWVEVSPTSEFGIDLVAKVNLQKELFDALPRGSYSGAREIMIPSASGKAYYVRGQFQDAEMAGGTKVEEVRVLLVHPTENRLVTFTTRYPEATSELSKERIQELFDWVGEISALREWEDPQSEASTEDPN